jgi:hypothetical protein
MTSYQFFEEFRDDDRTISSGSIIAIAPEPPIVHDGAVHCRALRTVRPSPTDAELVAPILLSAEYLGTHCRQVTEERAREVEPVIFQFLDRLA